MGLAATSLQASVRLSKIFSSHAVLQRDQPIHVWGWAAPEERISVSLNGPAQTTAADRLGNWSVYLSPQSAGGPYTLTAAGANKIVLDDIMIGDVWFASGQSNMEMPLKGFVGSAPLKNGAEEIRNANQPLLRLLFIPHKASAYPLADFEGKVGWTTCTPETAADFSAVAYFFGREIAAKEHVTVGLIDSTWGGTPGEAWVSGDTLTSDASFMPVFATWTKMANQQTAMAATLAAEKAEDEAAKKNHVEPPKHQWHPNPDSYNPSWLFNGMVSPAVGFALKGVIWYQGETNSRLDRAALYHKVFSGLIADWREKWREGDFPFLFVQISSFKSSPNEEWAQVREAQRRTLSLANTGMAVTIDVGDPDNVHPADKQTVGARLALAGRAIAYHESLEYSGPLFRQASTDGESIRIWFDHADSGLAAKGDALSGFEVAGDDHRFVPAAARIDGKSVLATSSSVASPKFVRYGWRNVPEVNLYNAAGLPASPFTSE